MTDIEVAGIPVTSFNSVKDAVSRILPANGPIRGSATAINALKVVEADRQPNIKHLLLGASIRYADGFPIALAMRWRGADSVRIPGCELWEALMAEAGARQIRVYLLGGTPEVNAGAANRLREELGVLIVGATDGYGSDSSMIEHVVTSRPEFVTVALGSPRQERFIAECQSRYPEAFYMGVGGSLDVYTGHVRRAPLPLRKIGLEWLYRLLAQPARLSRQRRLIHFVRMAVAGRL